MTRSGHYVTLFCHLKFVHLLSESKHHWSDSGGSWVRMWALSWSQREDTWEPQADRNAILGVRSLVVLLQQWRVDVKWGKSWQWWAVAGYETLHLLVAAMGIATKQRDSNSNINQSFRGFRKGHIGSIWWIIRDLMMMKLKLPTIC